MSGTVVFLASRAQAADFLGRRAADYPGARLVGLTPAALHFLRQAGREASFPEDYFDCEREYRLLYREMTDARERFESAMDRWAEEQDPWFREAQVRPFASLGYHWKRLFDNLAVKLVAVDAVFAAEAPERVVGYAAPLAYDRDSLQYQDEAGVFHALIQLLAGRRGRCVETLPAVGADADASAGRPAGLPALQYRAKEWLRRGWAARRGRRPGGAARTTILFNPMMANLSALQEPLAAAGYRIHRLEVERYRQLWVAPTPAGETVIPLEMVPPEIGRCRGVDLTALTGPPIQSVIARLPVLGRIDRELGEELEREGVELVLTDTLLATQFSGNLLLAAAARRRGIPVTGWLHGGCNDDPWHLPDVWVRYELCHCDEYLVHGRKQAELFRAYLGAVERPVLRAVGSPAIERHYRSPRAAAGPETTVTYVLKALFNNQRYLGWESELLWTDNRYYLFSRRVIELLRQSLPGCRIRLKLHGRYDGVYDDLAAGGKLELIAADTNLTALLAEPQLLVFDYVSTGFFLGAAAGHDLMVYSPVVWNTPAQAAIRARAYCCGTETEFQSALQRYAREGDWAGKRQDREFNAAFLNHPERQQAAANAVREVTAIITSRRAAAPRAGEPKTRE